MLILGHYLSHTFLYIDMELEGKDKTERFIIAAKERAKAALHEASPKLTSLERGMWQALKSGRGARSIHRKGTDKAA